MNDSLFVLTIAVFLVIVVCAAWYRDTRPDDWQPKKLSDFDNNTPL